MTYECPICLSVNHSSKPRCSICGTIPARYSMTGKPTKTIDMSSELFTSGCGDSIEVVVAFGVARCNFSHATHAALRTVSALYYAESEV